MWNVMRPSGRRRMLVMWTGSPPPNCDRLDGVVYGVNESLAALGYGTDDVNMRGPDGPSTPCDSSRMGRLPITRQISRPSAGRLESKPFFLRFSSRKYSLPSDLTSTLMQSLGASSMGDRISFCFTVGSTTAGFVQASFSLH